MTKKNMMVQRAVVEGVEGAAEQWLREHPEDRTPPSPWEVENYIQEVE